MNLAQYVLESGSAYGGDRPAILYAGKAWSFDRLSDEVARLAATLAGLGVERGDRIMALMANRPEYYVAYLAAARLGAICATVNIDYTIGEIAHIARHAQPKCAVADQAGIAKLERARATETVPTLQVVGVDAAERPDHHHYARIAEGAAPAGYADVGGDAGVLLCYTSGTSGAPKPVLTGHAGEIWAARSFRSMWRLSWNDRVAVALPLAWVYGLGTVSIPALSCGATVVLLPRFRPDLLCDAVAAARATVFAGVTTMYRMVVEYAASQPSPPDLRSLRLAMTGGERRNEVVFDAFERLSGIPVHDLYACSEARPILGYDPIATPRPLSGAAGILFPGVEAELRDDNGNVVPASETGELHVRSPNTFKEYYKEPELTADKVDAHGWVRTGDLFRVDEQGFWHIQGRKDADMINRSGAKVAPPEVEAHLVKHPRIREAVVVGRPDPRYGEEVVAVIVGDMREDEALALVRQHCQNALADYKTPTSVIVLADMPYGSTGKINRRALIELAAAGR